jgi:DNA polymerase beta
MMSVVCRVPCAVADDCDDDQGTEAQKLDGIGKKIGLKIDEILATGKLKKLDTLNLDPTTKALNLIQQVHM